MDYKASIDKLLTECENEQTVRDIMEYVCEQGEYRQHIIRRAREVSAWEILEIALKKVRQKGFTLRCESEMDFGDEIGDIRSLQNYFELNLDDTSSDNSL